MRILFFLMLMTTCFFSGIAQKKAGVRYRDKIFSQVNLSKDIRYRESPIGKSSKSSILLDLYEPGGDDAAKRPLIIWIHGGGFKFGKKTTRGTPLWSRDFARRGYVCMAMNYRKSRKNTLQSFPALVDGCMQAMEDAEHAISFLKKNCVKYRIDTNKIILAGNSAGGMLALHEVYSSFAELAKISGSKADTFSIKYNPHKVVAVINFWGAIFDSSFLRNAKVPIISVHGMKDRVVPYYSFVTSMAGSGIIHRYATTLGITNKLLPFKKHAHELQKHFLPFYAGGPAKRRWREASAYAAINLFSILDYK